jgi:hypothetical protein
MAIALEAKAAHQCSCSCSCGRCSCSYQHARGFTAALAIRTVHPLLGASTFFARGGTVRQPGKYWGIDPLARAGWRLIFLPLQLACAGDARCASACCRERQILSFTRPPLVTGPLCLRLCVRHRRAPACFGKRLAFCHLLQLLGDTAPVARVSTQESVCGTVNAAPSRNLHTNTCGMA